MNADMNRTNANLAAEVDMVIEARLCAMRLVQNEGNRKWKRLPWRGQRGRAAAGSAALSLRCAASTSADVYTGYA
jgi:hypothetical protein